MGTRRRFESAPTVWIVQRSKLLDKMELADQFVPAILELAEARLSDVLIEIAVYP